MSKYLILGLCLYCSNLLAIIPGVYFKDVTKYFKDPKDSPTVGKIAIDSGFIYNLRFFGNFEKGLNKEGNWETVKDAGNDPIMKLVIMLFPSLPYQLTTENMGLESFGKDISIKTISDMLVFLKEVRTIITNKRGNIEKAMTSINQLPGAYKKKYLKKETLVNDSLAKMLIDALLCEYNQSFKAPSSLSEKYEDSSSGSSRSTTPSSTGSSVSEESIYPLYTTEQIILAFFTQHYSTKQDIFKLMMLLPDSFFKESNQVDSQPDDQISMWDKESIAQEEGLIRDNPDYKPSLDFAYYYTNYDINAPIPYKMWMDPLGNGTGCQAYDRLNDQLLNTTFADCHETAIRHFANMILFDKESENFKLPDIQSLEWQNVVDFYKHQPPIDANNGAPELRSHWNRVVGDLNGLNMDIQNLTIKKYEDFDFKIKKHEDFDFKIKKYVNDTIEAVKEEDSSFVQYVSGTYNLNSGFKNFIFVWKKLLGDKLDISPPPTGQTNTLQWVIQSLKKIITVLNPTLEVQDISFQNFKEADNHGGKAKDYYGAVIFQLKNKNGKVFQFMLNQEPGHIMVNSIKYDHAEKISIDLKAYTSIFKVPSIKLLDANNEIDLYRLLGQGKLDDNSKKIRLFKNNANIKDAYAPTLGKIIQSIDFNHAEVVVNFINATEYIPSINSKLTSYIPVVAYAFYEKNKSDFIKNGVSRLKRIDVTKDCDSVDLTELGSLEEVLIQFNVNIMDLTLPNSPNLKNISLGGIIENADLDLRQAIFLEYIYVGDRCKIKNLTLPNSPNLKMIYLGGIIENVDLSQARSLKIFDIGNSVEINRLILPRSKESLIKRFKDKIKRLELVDG